MKKYKISLLLLLWLLLPITVAASGYIDTEREGSLCIQAVYGGSTCINGMEFQVYRTADINEYGELINESETPIPCGTGQTDENGLLRFEGFKPGVYLICANAKEQNRFIYSMESFSVMLPQENSKTNTWEYDVTAQVKLGIAQVQAKYSVSKIWEDDGHEAERPKSITIHLLCDGVVCDTITLPEEGRWKHEWEKLDVNHDWSVQEEAVPGYEVFITRDATDFYITNTYKGENPKKPGKLPQTGQLWWPVPVLLCAGLIFLIAGLLCRSKKKHEE